MYTNLVFIILVFLAVFIYLILKKHLYTEQYENPESNNNNGKKRNIYYLLPSLDTDIMKYFGLYIPSNKDTSNNNCVFTTSLSSNHWDGPTENSGPEDGSVIVSMTYTPNKDIIGIGKNIGDDDEIVYNMYKKPCIDSKAVWEKIKSNKNIRSVLYDKDNKLIGCEYLTGHIYKKQTTDISSDWQGPLNNNVPMKKMMYDRDRRLLGIGLNDNFIYKKRGIDWLNEDWDTEYVNKIEVYDLLHDVDGKLIATTENGLYKQIDTSYMSSFDKLNDVENGKKILALDDIIYYKCGVSLLDDYLLPNEYKDSNITLLNNVLEFKQKAKKMCKKREFMLNEVDSQNSLIIQKQNTLISDIEDMINKLKN
tara:strand:+ start:19994 stop:21088 length:1095 start_codon:yes stop_codon:yes gene_type:complete